MSLSYKFHKLINKFLSPTVKLLGIDYFIFKWRHLSKTILRSRVPLYLLGAIFMLMGVAILGFVIIFLYSQPWTGFVEVQGSGTGSGSPKTLWDWMELCIVPIGLALIAFFFRISEAKSESQQTQDRKRDDAVIAYFGQLQSILLETNSSDEQNSDVASKLATARTISLVRNLDPERKLIILRYLFEAGLIKGKKPFIGMERVDFSHLSEYKLYLSSANLHGVNLNYARLESGYLDEVYFSGGSLYKAELSFSQLRRANFEYTRLEKADFYFAQLQDARFNKAHARKANFSGAFLEGASFGSADLSRANFRKAKLKKSYLGRTTLEHANLKNAELIEADLTDANLMYANLQGADLTGADLTGAIVSQSQLRKAKSFSGAILDGIRERISSPPISDGDKADNIDQKDQSNLNKDE